MPEATEVKDAPEAQASFTREQAETMIAEAIRQDREERDGEMQATKEEVADLRATNHRLDVERQIAKLNEAKLPPAFTKKAEEILLGLKPDTAEIQLTRAEDGKDPEEVSLSVGEMIAELAETVPQALDAGDHGPKLKGDKPDGGGKTPEERAAEIAAELETEDVALVDADLTLTD